MCSVGLATLGVSTFLAGSSRRNIDSHHENNSSRNSSWCASQILGKFHVLLPIRHSNLCCYVDIIKCKHDRMIVISELYPKNLLNSTLSTSLKHDFPMLLRMCLDVFSGLEFLNRRGLKHGCLAPSNILYDERHSIFKISEYGTVHMKGSGLYAELVFKDAKYLAPEVLLIGLNSNQVQLPVLFPESDVWSFGIIIAEILEIVNLTTITLKEWIKLIFSSENHIGRSIWSCDKMPQEFSENIKTILLKSLVVLPTKRISPSDMLKMMKSFISCVNIQTYSQRATENDVLWGTFPPLRLCKMMIDSLMSEEQFEIFQTNPVLSRPVDEVHRLWKLAGGDVIAELKENGHIQEKASILDLPLLECHDQSLTAKASQSELDPSGILITLKMDSVKRKLEDLPLEVFFPLMTRSNDYENLIGDFLKEMIQQPLIVRENSAKYQLCRQVYFHRLLASYPYLSSVIRKEAMTDIPPLYRNLVWAALLGIKGDVLERYDAIDKDSPGSSDRQIDVDIPRCHQYNILMASKEAHGKLKRLLKAWINEHPQFVYWQGLDSLTAPFLYLNFSNEALAYACLCAFVKKYVHKFFLKDNTPVIQEYLAVFSHLLAFHDPILHTHLTGIGFLPELYSIPWFLTMFTHVFPLHKVFHLWDRLLLGDDSFPLFVGLSLLVQLRSRLLSYGFNDCILLFSDFPDLDIQSCLLLAEEMFEHTPRSATFRVHTEIGLVGKTEEHFYECPTGDCEIELDMLRTEVSPRITWMELEWLTASTKHNSKRKPAIPLLIDVRTSDEFSRGTLPHSINIPFLTAFGADGELLPTFESRSLEDRRGKLIIVFDGRCKHAPKFSAELVRLGFPRVCTLHLGIDQLKSSGFITVPSSSG